MIKTGARFTLGRNIGLAEGGITKTATGKKKKKNHIKDVKTIKVRSRLLHERSQLYVWRPGGQESSRTRRQSLMPFRDGHRVWLPHLSRAKKFHHQTHGCNG